jgi:hypothetical protein
VVAEPWRGWEITPRRYYSTYLTGGLPLTHGVETFGQAQWRGRETTPRWGDHATTLLPLTTHQFRLPLAAEVDPGGFPAGNVGFRQIAHGVDGPMLITVGHVGSVMDRPRKREWTRFGRKPITVGWLHARLLSARRQTGPPGSIA